MMMHQAPMLSAPLKQTNEIDWIHPLKAYIRDQYGDDPERYSEECSMLNRLRQDMRGAGKDSASGRDLLYRYYGQLELLDLRFPVDEHHIRISFTWFDAFTLKPTAQYSLAYEKASIIFNISAVLSCHAAVQNRNDEVGLKTAYHSFQAAAGMFTYINENFLHAPSTDLSRDTVKTLISLMLAQGQEVFLEKQVADQKKVGLLAKLASQAAWLYSQAMDGVQENVTKAIFERVWLLVVQVKANHMASLAQYYQAMADNDANAHGVALCRLQVAETQATEAHRIANSFPSTIPPISNLTTETSVLLSDIAHRHLVHIQEKITEFSKDNDFIYHQPIPADSTLQTIPKLPAAKAIPVSELYQGQDIQRIIGPDIFQRIVPMAVTENASMYDEEKAKLMRAETERVEIANGELEASLDYLKLPHSLNVLKGGQELDIGVDPDFRRWCEALSGHSPFASQFEQLKADRTTVTSLLDQCTKSLDMEETVCEKMRSKYGDDWTQQPSSRITGTLRTDIRNYRQVVEEASTNDAQLYSSFRQNESDFEEMRSAGETDEADVFYQRAMIKAGAGGGKGKSSGNLLNEGNLLDDDFDNGPSINDQIAHIEELVRKVQLVKKEREQVLKDLRERIHNDDISNILILQKKSLSSDSNQIFKAELEKFRPHTNRLLQANHKQTALLKELTRTFDALLMDKRVRADQQKYESFNRSRTSVINKYKKVFQSYQDLVEGLSRAKQFYSEMKETVSSLQSNVQTFVNNRRNEGSQLLAGIEALKAQSNTSGLVDWERGGLSDLMGRMSVEPHKASPAPPAPPASRPLHYAAPHSSSSLGGYASPPPPPPPSIQQNRPANINITPYNPGHHQPLSPPLPGQQFNQQQPNINRQSQLSFSSPPPQQPQSQQYNHYNSTGAPPQTQRSSYQQQSQSQQAGGMPMGWQPPPPPPGPPPSQQDYNFGLGGQNGGMYPNGPGGYANNAPRQPPAQQYGGQPQGHQQPQQNGNDPWSGLSGWK